MTASDGSDTAGGGEDDTPAGGEGDRDASEGPQRLTAWVHGAVQGVGFRWWVRSVALTLGLAGRATNLPDGRVQVVAEGSRADLAQLLDRLGRPDPGGVGSAVRRRPGSVSLVTHRFTAAHGLPPGFTEG